MGNEQVAAMFTFCEVERRLHSKNHATQRKYMLFTCFNLLRKQYLIGGVLAFFHDSFERGDPFVSASPLGSSVVFVETTMNETARYLKIDSER